MELYLSGSITNDKYTQMEEQGVLFLLQTFYEMKSWKEEKVKEVYTKDFGWIAKNESLIIEAENKEGAYFEASAKGTVLFVK